MHGIVLCALADHACNAYGKISLGLSTTIQFIESAKPGVSIIAKATENKRNYRTGFYCMTFFKEKT